MTDVSNINDSNMTSVQPVELSPASPDPFDPARLRLPMDFAAAAGVKRILTTIPVHKPRKEQFFRVRPGDDHRQAPASIRFLSIEPLLEDLGRPDLTAIHWVIVGGESGPGARPLNKEWVENIRQQCEAADVPFIFKQWGSVHKPKAARELNGRTYHDMPEREANEVPSRRIRLQMIDQVGQEDLAQA
jgi:hypothetical protein